MPRVQFTKLHAIVFVAILLVSGAGYGGYTIYAKYQADQRTAAEKVRLERERVASEKAAACRANLVKSKTDQIGKATYAELYGSSCN